MATKTWTGATSGAWDTAGNWLGGVVPAGGDDLVWDRGSQSVTTGPASAIALASLKIKPTYTGSFAVLVTLDTITLLEVAGSGGSYNLSAPVTTCYAYLGNGTTLITTGGTWTNMYASGTSGGRLMNNGATITNRYCTNISVDESSAAGDSTIVQMSGGSFRSDNNPGTLTTDGACNVVIGGQGSAVTVTAAIIGSGGSYSHQSSGTITALTLRPGASFPCRGSVASFTITTLNIWPGASINRHPPGATVTITTELALGYSGGVSADGP